MNVEKDVYFYNACAMALGGTVTRPFNAVIESQAASVLPLDGGMGTARVENFQFKDIVSFKAGYSLVTGSQSSSGFETLALATVEDLNILHHMVTATRVVSRLVTDTPSLYRPPAGTSTSGSPSATPSGSSAPARQLPTISTLGSQIMGLTIAGCELEVVLDTDFFGDSDKTDAYKKAKARKEAKTLSNGMVVTSLVKEFKKVRGSCAGIAISEDLGRIDVPHFGRIQVAQFLLTESFSWRLVMLRVLMGCPAAGTMDAGCTQGNGIPP